MPSVKLLNVGTAAVVSVLAGGCNAQVPLTITGGGVTAGASDYLNEMTEFNSASTGAIFQNVNPNGGTTVYWPSGSGVGQLAFLNNDNTCNSSIVLTGHLNCSGLLGGDNAVDYAASGAVLSSSQITSWPTLPYGQAISGNLIQLPSMGEGIAFPIINSKFSENGQAALTDNDLCNVFTGGFTDWSQTSIASQVAAGPITVVFRGDGSGTSFLFLNHLTAVCIGSSAPPSGVTLSATTTFASIFPTTQGGIFQKPFQPSYPNGPIYYSPSNFQPFYGSSGVANYLSGQSYDGKPVLPPISAIAYLTPDYTTVDPNSNAVLADGTKSKLVVAAVITPDLINPHVGKAYTPTVENIIAGLNNPLRGQFLTPPMGSQLSNPSAYVPLISMTKTGYPIVGYTTFDLAQCYKVANVGASIKKFLINHYGKASYTTDQANNGFPAVKATKAFGFVTVIEANITSNKSGNNLDIGDKIACEGIGR